MKMALYGPAIALLFLMI